MTGPRSTVASAGLTASLFASLREPSFWIYSSWLEVASRYRRSAFGLAWLCLPTAVYLLLIGNMYSRLMHYPLAAYLPYLAIGYCVWRLMLHIINDASGTFQQHKAFIMDGRVRLTDFLLRSFAKAGINFGFSMLVASIAILWSQSWVGLLSLSTLFVTLPLLLVNMFWIAVCISLVGARFPDVRDAISTILVAGFLLTPILWTIDRFPPDSWRGGLARLNPAYHLIEVVREPILLKMPGMTSIAVSIGLAVVGWVVASLLYRRYARFVALWV